MTDALIEEGAELWLDRGSHRYALGEMLCGGYRLSDWRDSGLVAVELSVLWYTAGQGEEDFFVHHFERHKEAELPVRVEETPHLVETVLPASPLSYDGQIVKVCWTVRLRGFFSSGRQRVIEAPFWLLSEVETPPTSPIDSGREVNA